MFHEITDSQLKQRKRRRRVVAVVAAILVVALIAVGMVIRQNGREQGAVALRNSISDAAARCCAVEGSYPSSLSYLEDKYGVVVNTDDYVVTYESYASNIAPTVVVVPR